MDLPGVEREFLKSAPCYAEPREVVLRGLR